MSSNESPQVRALWERIHALDALAVFSGSMPGPDEQRYSYHWSWDDSPHDGGYSVHYWGDAHPVRSARGFAAALDVGYWNHPGRLQVITARFHHFAVSHPKAYYTHGLREFAGTVDGRSTFGWDLTSRSRTYGWDSSHLGHLHLSFNRRYVNTQRILDLAALFRA